MIVQPMISENLSLSYTTGAPAQPTCMLAAKPTCHLFMVTQGKCFSMKWHERHSQNHGLDAQMCWNFGFCKHK